MADPEQYTALALRFAYRFAREPAAIIDNIRHIGELMRTAPWLSSSDPLEEWIATAPGRLRAADEEVVA